MSRDQLRRRSFPMNLINNSLCSLNSQDSLQAGGDSVAEFFINLRFTDIFDLPGEYFQMIPEMFSALSDGDKEWLGKLRSHGTLLPAGMFQERSRRLYSSSCCYMGSGTSEEHCLTLSMSSIGAKLKGSAYNPCGGSCGSVNYC
ncbi:hypothetical protein AT4G03505 [Arabidopsis thaliana]|uniref:Uncharacterized protein n=2 Tax=Arabidopsis thaliana TaxID=3702 RepID=Q2V3L5_ARATH|nr:uncharacterized protein AT4G03505 [Arabidopsis thaliana]ABF59375.1 unknown protein [Arabidopsis thaliana]AEE82330.1 hypothetical protein AT4G03505 [Arabidopsis thaliana]|eukprot:NP_001031582.1 hypothetical protein AT4G03505 [Arabidopsis thaliana]